MLKKKFDDLLIILILMRLIVMVLHIWYPNNAYTNAITQMFEGYTFLCLVLMFFYNGDSDE